jgi:tetratricopeptide (TPR) repeat protein
VLRGVVKRWPGFPAAWENLAAGLLAVGELDEAEPAAREAIRLIAEEKRPAADTATIYNTLGMILEARGDLEGALEQSRRAADQDHKRAMPPANMAINLNGLGRGPEARVAAREAIRRATRAIARNPRDAEAFGMRGSALNNLGRPNEALLDLREATRLEPTNFYWWWVLGHSLKAMGKSDEQLSAWARAVSLCREQGRERSHSFGVLLTQISTAHRIQGRFTEALSAGREATRVLPASSNVWADYTRALDDSGDRPGTLKAADKTVRLGRQALARWPNNPHYRQHVALVLMVSSRPEEAVKEWRALLAKFPHDAGAMNDLRECLRRVGTPAALQEAYKMFPLTVRLYSPTAHDPYFEQSIIARRLGKTAEAVAMGREAVRLNPSSLNCRVVLANALREAGRQDEAIAEYRAILAIRPDYRFAHVNLGSLLWGLGRNAEAVPHIRAGGMLGEDWRIDFSLAGVLAAGSDAPACLAAVRAALANPKTPAVMKLQLNSIKDAALTALGRSAGNVLGERLPAAEAAARLVALHERVEAVAAGKTKPRDAKDKAMLARHAWYFPRRTALAARLMEEAFYEDAALNAGLNRILAELSALSASVGIGSDAPPEADELGRKRYRLLALGWLEGDIKEPGLAEMAVLNALHGHVSIARLKTPEQQRLMLPAEKARWQKLFSRIDSLLAPPKMKPAD